MAKKEKQPVSGLPTTYYFYKGETLPNGKVVTQSRVGYNISTGKELTVREVQTLQHGGVSFEKRRAGQVKSVPIKKPGVKKDAFLEKNKGWKKVKGGEGKAFKQDYYQKGTAVLSKYGARQVTSGKATIAEQLTRYKPGFIGKYYEYINDADRYEVKTLKQAEDLAQFEEISRKRHVLTVLHGVKKITYEGESSDDGYRTVSSTAWPVYTKTPYWEYVQELADGWFRGGKILGVSLIFYKRKIDLQ